MAVIVDMLSGVLNGSGVGVAVDTPKDKPIVGSSFLAIKTEAFCEQGEFTILPRKGRQCPVAQ